MPRPRKGPRLYLDAKHGYVIRDGGVFIRTGCAQHQLAVAEKQLAEYIGKKHQPQASPAPLIADVLLVYLNEHLAHSRSRSKATPVTNLAAWWGDKRVSDITSASCRAYIAHKGERTVAARRDLQTLKAAVNYWHKSEYGPLDRVPAVVMPPAPESRERWLTRSELARLLWAARRTPHLRRFILIGYYTGSRSGVVRELQWSWIDWNGGTMRRRAIGEAEQSNKRRPRVRLGKRILAHLRRWHRLDGPHANHVVHYNGQPIRRELHSFDRAVARAGLGDNVVVHTLRHSRATYLMQSGADPWEVSGHLGMSIQTLTRTYTTTRTTKRTSQTFSFCAQSYPFRAQTVHRQ